MLYNILTQLYRDYIGLIYLDNRIDVFFGKFQVNPVIDQKQGNTRICRILAIYMNNDYPSTSFQIQRFNLHHQGD